MAVPTRLVQREGVPPQGLRVPARARAAGRRDPGLGDGADVAALLAGLAGAACLRLAVGGPSGVRSPSAGLAFAIALTGLGLLRRRGVRRRGVRREVGGRVGGRPFPGRRWADRGARRWIARRWVTRSRWAGWGVAGAVVLCLVPLLVHLRQPGGSLPGQDLPGWATVVAAVAVAEEWLLRGALFDAARAWHGDAPAVVVTTVAFGLLHVPFYGWTALPLDLAVGLLLGGLRQASGSWRAPAVAHTLADLAGWWLR
jgi:membrane protease YdiL (CAAX protease family)